jgi:hypothetical protein
MATINQIHLVAGISTIEEIYSGYRLMINGKGKDNIQENL